MKSRKEDMEETVLLQVKAKCIGFLKEKAVGRNIKRKSHHNFDMTSALGQTDTPGCVLAIGTRRTLQPQSL